jgi:ribosomal protein L23
MKKIILRNRWIKSNAWNQEALSWSHILKWLLQWEKAFGAIETLGKYTFFVPMKVNKIDIARGFEQVYWVKPISVNTIVMPSKYGSRRQKRKSLKKAVITVSKDSKIEII